MCERDRERKKARIAKTIRDTKTNKEILQCPMRTDQSINDKNILLMRLPSPITDELYSSKTERRELTTRLVPTMSRASFYYSTKTNNRYDTYHGSKPSFYRTEKAHKTSEQNQNQNKTKTAKKKNQRA